MAGSPAQEQPVVQQVAESPRPQVEQVQRPNFRRGEEAAQAEFRRIVNEKKTGKVNPREALSGIAGWRQMGKVDSQVSSMNREVIKLRDSGIINDERATEMFLRIQSFSVESTKQFMPRLHQLDDVVKANEKPGQELDPFLRDLNYWTIKHDIKSLGSADDPRSKSDRDQLTKDLALAEKERNGLGPGQDEVINLVLKLTGEKVLPIQYRDSPLDAIDAFFTNNNLSGVLKNEAQASKLATRMGLSVEQVRVLVTTYNQGRQLEVGLKSLSEEITILDPVEGKGLRAKSKIKSIFNIASLLSMFSAYAIYAQMKKESGQPVG